MGLKRYRYTGKERDEETGFCYYGLRYYVPGLGRWINTDPASLGDGLNLYRFARVNPVTLADARGTDSKSSTGSKTTLLQDFEDVVERRHRDDSLHAIRLGGGDNEQRLANAFITLAEKAAPNCSAKVSAEEAFDRGAAIFAKALGFERQLASAAARGDFERAQQPAAVGLYEEFGTEVRNGLAGPGIVPVQQTHAQHQNMQDARDRSRLNLFKVECDLVASMGNAEGLDVRAGPEPAPSPAAAVGPRNGGAGGHGEATAHAPAVTVDGHPGLVHVPGAVSKITHDVAEVQLFEHSVAQGRELATFTQNGVQASRAGTAREVSLPTQGVTETLHAHQASGLGLPSTGDVNSFAGRFAPSTNHGVLGRAFPTADAFLISEGLPPTGLVLKTTFTQQGLNHAYIRLPIP